MGLEAKKIAYKVINITPGIDQIDIFRIFGQRQVPVIVDVDKIIADSTAILHYLDDIEKEPKCCQKSLRKLP